MCSTFNKNDSNIEVFVLLLTPTNKKYAQHLQ